jgi:hypothetical protein
MIIFSQTKCFQTNDFMVDPSSFHKTLIEALGAKCRGENFQAAAIEGKHVATNSLFEVRAL